jgi:hypothetical protein
MKNLIMCIAFVGTSCLLWGQNNTPCPCCTEQHRQFDFWLGDWETFVNDKLAGTNVIVLMQDSCIIQENWISAGGQFTGTSYNFYDARKDQWHQTWVDNQGGNLQLNGGFENGSMIMSSEMTTDQNGDPIYHRVTWTPNPDATVRQHWESSPDGKDNWTTLFDGLYKRKADQD